MNPKEMKAFKELKSDLDDYPEMLMISVARKDLELIIKYLEKENKKSL